MLVGSAFVGTFKDKLGFLIDQNTIWGTGDMLLTFI